MTTLSPAQQTIALNRLVHSKTNVRRTGRSRAIETLMASIEAHGLRQNLNVKPTSGNRFEVVAGGRRLAALRQLMKDGRIARDAAIPCVVLASDDNPAEISLAENTIREAMHPDDQCEAFQTLIRSGISHEDVAARFGVTPAVVRQRLRLATVSPTLRRLFRKGDLDLAQMMAFALIDDHAAQEAAWAELPEWNRGADAIRRALSEEGLPATSRLARYVGIEAYEAAGGTLLRDLFDEDQPAIFADGALLERLAMQKLEEAACYVKAEGWQWIDVALKPDYSTQYGQVYPRHDADEDAEVDGYDPADLARAGARITLSYDGEAVIERGLIHPETMKAERRASAATSPDAGVTLPDSLVRDLSAQRTAALRLELSEKPLLALRALLHGFALTFVYDDHGNRSCLDIRINSEPLARDIRHISDCPAVHALDERLAGATAAFPDNPASLWEWCQSLEQEAVIELLAILTAYSLNAVAGKNHGGRSPRLQHADQLADALSLDMHEHWTPDPETFFGRLSKAQMQSFLREADAHDQAALIGKYKKQEAARRTGKTLLGKGWLPDAFLVTPVAAPGDDADDRLDVEDADPAQHYDDHDGGDDDDDQQQHDDRHDDDGDGDNQAGVSA
ncbi:MAG TPA: ParB/RepB/Spo0J family partition protein [Devosiaceae bacterium]|jgi:ParB family chromosome partitioning protein|nr:ParB/RepB/Spo0J family partition protein [Devosiaceae bacterium]